MLFRIAAACCQIGDICHGWQLDHSFGPIAATIPGLADIRRNSKKLPQPHNSPSATQPVKASDQHADVAHASYGT